MIKFKRFIAEGIRSGLPHIHSDHPGAPSLTSTVSKAKDQLHSLIHTGRVKGHVTEKTDGMAFECGHDENGFYTRTSRSEKMRHKGDYAKAAKAKFGKDYNKSISGNHDRLHHALHQNENLQKYLRNHAEKHGSVRMKGEVFHRPQGIEHDGHITFVGTKYHTKHLGSEGAFVLHHRLPENHGHAHGSIHALSDGKMKFHHDDVEHHVDVDVSHERDRLKKVDPGIKKKAHPHYAELQSIAQSVHSKVAKAVGKNKPKWGPETEGHVLHPHDHNAPRVKVVAADFRDRKKRTEDKFK